MDKELEIEKLAQRICRADIDCSHKKCGHCSGFSCLFQHTSPLDIAEWHLEEINKADQRGYVRGYFTRDLEDKS